VVAVRPHDDKPHLSVIRLACGHELVCGQEDLDAGAGARLYRCASCEHRDLHAAAARLCLENLGTPEARHDGEGFAVVWVDGSEAEILAVFGVTPRELNYIIAADDGCFGLRADLPVGLVRCELLCHVRTGLPPGCCYLEVARIDGKPAIEVYL